MKSLPDEKPPPDWDSFETYQGPAPRELPAWLDSLLRGMFGLLGLAGLFALSGGILLLLVDQSARGLDRRFDLHATPGPAALWVSFLLGGLAGTFPVIRWWRRAQKEPIQENRRRRG